MRVLENVMAWDIISTIFEAVSKKMVAGTTGLEINALIKEQLEKYDCASTVLGYKGGHSKFPYPAYACINVNDGIAHNFPNATPFVEGDLVNVDFGLMYDGNCADCAMTFPIGEVSRADQNLLRFTKEALYAGIRKIKAGARIWDIATEIVRTANGRGYACNRVMAGHGIGKEMHEKPDIPMHRYDSFTGDSVAYVESYFPNVELKAGQIICLEPMLTRVDEVGQIAENGWELKTRDGRKSAMFEHMILVKEAGFDILTKHFFYED